MRSFVSIYVWVVDLNMVYVASCGVIVPLMTFAYEFGEGFVQS